MHKLGPSNIWLWLLMFLMFNRLCDIINVWYSIDTLYCGNSAKNMMRGLGGSARRPRHVALICCMARLGAERSRPRRVQCILIGMVPVEQKQHTPILFY